MGRKFFIIRKKERKGKKNNKVHAWQVYMQKHLFKLQGRWHKKILFIAIAVLFSTCKKGEEEASNFNCMHLSAAFYDEFLYKRRKIIFALLKYMKHFINLSCFCSTLILSFFFLVISDHVREFTCGKLYYRTFHLDEDRDALYVGAM